MKSRWKKSIRKSEGVVLKQKKRFFSAAPALLIMEFLLSVVLLEKQRRTIPFQGRKRPG